MKRHLMMWAARWLAALAALPTVTPGAAAPADGYRLVWADEFNADGRPDPGNWIFERGFVRNQELQWYRPENAVCSNGLLVIEARRERTPNPAYREGHSSWYRSRAFAEYTSAGLMTKGLHTWQYGRFEVRARLSARSGLWPAIWFVGTKGSWPDCGEIDLMEYYGGKIMANACWGGPERGKAVWDDTKTPLASFDDPDWDRTFHVWRMEWDETNIVLAVDGRVLNTIDLTKTLNPEGREPRNPFHQPHYLLLNLAIGGHMGGDPSKTPFPTRYEIDYVRVYQKPAR